jgi:hypothetical protein
MDRDLGQESEAKMENATEVHQPTSSARICEHPECETVLGSTNLSGRCAKHFHWKGTSKARSNRGNGHAAANAVRGNGSTAENGVADERELVATRLDRLFASMTVADKCKLAEAWLRGEI